MADADNAKQETRLFHPPAALAQDAAIPGISVMDTLRNLFPSIVAFKQALLVLRCGGLQKKFASPHIRIRNERALPVPLHVIPLQGIRISRRPQESSVRFANESIWS